MQAHRRNRQLERIFKGLANHRRLEIMSLLRRDPGLTLSELEQRLDIDYRTASEHTRKLVLGGLIHKRYEGRQVNHRLSDRGKQVLRFCDALSPSPH